MTDYSSFIFNALDGVGQSVLDNRKRKAILEQQAYENQFGQRKYSDALMQDERDFAFRQSEAERAQRNADRGYGLDAARLQIARENAGRRDMPSTYDEFRLAQSDPAYKAYLDSRDRKGLSVTEKKEVFSAEDDLANLDQTIEMLDSAEKINPNTYDGVGASTRGWMGAKLPDWAVPDKIASPQAGTATAEYGNIMSQEAIKLMASSLKGATTDFELAKFESLLADPATPRDVRGRIIQRMKALAVRKKQMLADRIEGVRGQTYFQPQGGQPQGERPQASSNIPPQAAQELAADPSPEAIAEFNEMFGQGAAESVLGQ